jgi:cytidine deaminase
MLKPDFNSILDVKKRTELNEEESRMVDQAVDMLKLAYAPYSNFYVGSSILMEDGSTYGGCNQENASYPLCMCGERVALYHASMQKPHVKIKAIAITAKNIKMKLEKPIMPCGACRQVILEYEQRNGKPIKLYFRDDNDIIYIAESGASLMPYTFDGSYL